MPRNPALKQRQIRSISVHLKCISIRPSMPSSEHLRRSVELPDDSYFGCSFSARQRRTSTA